MTEDVSLTKTSEQFLTKTQDHLLKIVLEAKISAERQIAMVRAILSGEITSESSTTVLDDGDHFIISNRNILTDTDRRLIAFDREIALAILDVTDEIKEFAERKL